MNIQTWHIVLGIFIISAVALGGAIYMCKKSKDHPNRPFSALATMFIPLFGQLGSRLLTVSSGKGMAHIWLLFPLFFVPPFSLIPAWFVYNDMEAC